jgi:hypothetical protein
VSPYGLCGLRHNASDAHMNLSEYCHILEILAWGISSPGNSIRGPMQISCSSASALFLARFLMSALLNPSREFTSRVRFMRAMSASYLVRTTMTGTLTKCESSNLVELSIHSLFPSVPLLFNVRNSSVPVSRKRPPARGISKQSLPCMR